jgi:hypothetical protein
LVLNKKNGRKECVSVVFASEGLCHLKNFPFVFGFLYVMKRRMVDRLRLQYVDVERFDSKKVVLVGKNIYICPNMIKAAFF